MRRWNRKKLFSCGILILLLYYFGKSKKYNSKYSAIIKNARPVQVWEFISDFSNVKLVNPTILNFSIESETGNYNHWKYKVYYTEYLWQIPWITNYATANFEIKKLSLDNYAIYSKHETCFFTSFNCMNTESTFMIQSTTNKYETQYTEFIIYECPVILSSFCAREVLQQRNEIKKNLENVFKKIDYDTESLH